MSEPPTSSSVCRCQSIGLSVDGEAGWGARGVKSKGGQKKKGKAGGTKGKASPAVMAAKAKGKARKKKT